VDRLRGRTGKGNVSEASVLHIVTSAELKRLSGSRPRDGEQVRGVLTAARRTVSPGVQRHPTPVYWCNLRNVVSPLYSRPTRAGRVAQA